MWWSPLWCRAQLGGGNHSRYEISPGTQQFSLKNCRKCQKQSEFSEFAYESYDFEHQQRVLRCFWDGIEHHGLHLKPRTSREVARIQDSKPWCHGHGYICISTTIIFSDFHGLPCMFSRYLVAKKNCHQVESFNINGATWIQEGNPPMAGFDSCWVFSWFPFWPHFPIRNAEETPGLVTVIGIGEGDPISQQLSKTEGGLWWLWLVTPDTQTQSKYVCTHVCTVSGCTIARLHLATSLVLSAFHNFEEQGYLHIFI